MDISTLLDSYRKQTANPVQIVRSIYARIRTEGERPVWITLVDEEDAIARASALEMRADKSELPLYGIPFAVKDNFNISGMPTTAGCAEFSYLADTTATAVKLLLDAGAILIGKTNMDQFATGLVGTRTPYGVCTSVFHPEYISGGSSSGSAVAVARGLVSFSLGSDTAGSGRIPAAFNQLVGVKPTRGLVSNSGLLPACRSLDCVSIFAETCADAACVLQVMRGADELDAYSRSLRPGEDAAPWAAPEFRFGVPTSESLEFFGDQHAEENYRAAVSALERLGGTAVSFDYGEFRAAAALLYGGPWVAERLAAIEEFLSANFENMDPTVAKVIESGGAYSAVDGFRGQYRLQELKRDTAAVWARADFLLLPTAPTTYTIAEIAADPIELNSRLGYYTNFVNLLDLAAVAIPSGMRADGLPGGVSLIGRAFSDDGLLLIADKLHRELAKTLGASDRQLAATPPVTPRAGPPGCILMAVVGAHLTGQPLHWQLTMRKARLVKTIKTHADYRLYVLPNSTPAKPGLVYSPGFGGAGIELEVWAMPEDTVGSFLNGIPAPLSLGTVRLKDGTSVKGFLCEPAGIDGATLKSRILADGELIFRH